MTLQLRQAHKIGQVLLPAGARIRLDPAMEGALRAQGIADFTTEVPHWDGISEDAPNLPFLTADQMDELAKRLLVHSTLVEDNKSAVALTSAVAANVASVTLQPGWWELDGSVRYIGTPTLTYYGQGIHNVSANLPAQGFYTAHPHSGVPAIAPTAVPVRRIVEVTAAQVWYLVARAAFSGGAFAADGRLVARYLGKKR